MTRTAACSCGQLSIACEVEPLRISVCHCLACQKRTGSAFGSAAFFPREAVRITGESRLWTRRGDSGGELRFSHCPVCGSTVFWEADMRADRIAVALGAFADPAFPPPDRQVYAETAHPWLAVSGAESG